MLFSICILKLQREKDEINKKNTVTLQVVNVINKFLLTFSDRMLQDVWHVLPNESTFISDSETR